jgi:CHAT domain-containing protein/pimeloyl-ACP methyl ester carboxylesterase/tetratricopeptide (TPR) repeat protein
MAQNNEEQNFKGKSKKTRSSRASQTTKEPSDNPKKTFTVRGALVPSESVSEEPKARFIKKEIKAEFFPAEVRTEIPKDTKKVASDDMIEIEFEDGIRLWMSGEEYAERIREQSSRRLTDTAVMDVPAQLDLLPHSLKARGPVSWAIKSLKIIGVDLANMTAAKIAEKIEEDVPENASTKQKFKRPGLFRCHMVSEEFALEPAELKNVSANDPILVFIHGTGSSTWGSFGNLWSEKNKSALQTIHGRYGNRVLAFEHASLTKSPIENTLELIELLKQAHLPENARLHLVTHSRGGLIGELLCRGIEKHKDENSGGKSNPNAQPFEDREFQLFDSNENQKKLLIDLNSELQKKSFKVEKFVRVACPVLGTTLASGRLDRWLSVMGTICGTALPDTPLADFFKDFADFIAAVIKEHTSPDTFAGLEAMMPNSAFIKLVNWPQATAEGNLVVIAGDIEPTIWWSRLLIWVTDRFYEGDHDLIVNTPSMYGGVKRAVQELLSFHKGPGVNHFNYFENDASIQSFVQALTIDDLTTDGFVPLKKEKVDIARAIIPRSPEPRPVVFVLPGIMGSELNAGDDHVWLDIPDLIFGGLKQIRIDAPNIQATQPFSRYYGELIKYLRESHKVVPFPFDWRLPIEDEADRLASAVQHELDEAKKHKKPVRFLAHSMGGLVVRTMIARHEALWREICDHAGARLLMLGTPNGGSHAITELLVGQSSILRKLAWLDITNKKRDLLEIISRFPGVLAMLPKDTHEDYFSMETWKSYHDKANEDWILPDADDLKRAAKFRNLLDKASVDSEHMLYVAGVSDVTIESMELSEGEIQFWGTPNGDGRVTWDSGILPKVPTWYMDVEHGDLACHEQAFVALSELLEQGTTQLLPDSPPVARTPGVRFPIPPPSDDLYPDEDVLGATVLGAGPRKNRKTKRIFPPVQIRVVHGNLAYATNPVVVGHYAGDTIVSAERYIDGIMEGTLSRRLQLGLYPGKIGTNAIFINPKFRQNRETPLKGALVIGLGTVGTLSAFTLIQSITRALLDYAVFWADCCPNKTKRESAEKSVELKFTTLLIGTGAGGVSVSDSVFAILQAVLQANQSLDAADHKQHICAVEFIELWEDRALQAVQKMNEIIKQPLFMENFNFKGELEDRDGKQSRVSYEEEKDWWQRLQILGGTKKGEPDTGTLRFSASTRRARTEVRLLATQRELVDQFIKKSICSSWDSRAASRTLFELLLPNELKESAPRQDDLILILDEEAAKYPWELLEDPENERNNPMVIEHGLLRQLESFEYRETVHDVSDNTALVVGDPVSSYPKLKGAEQEAEQVWHTLENAGQFQVEHQIKSNADRIINALFARPYRILHLAGHGIYRHVPDDARLCKTCGQNLPENMAEKQLGQLEPVTGMIIGDNVVLSPKEVRQMRRVPELVFINCCFLGYIESDSKIEKTYRNEHTDHNRIAANVATEFIRMGVRAVIAAGWAVNDEAAATFAITFYTEMLNDKPFGQAVHEARKVTFNRHPASNTWGAYQCYGDPDYRLFGKQTIKAREVMELVSISQAISEINNIQARLKSIGLQDPWPDIDKLEKTEKLIKAKSTWLENGQLQAALGRAFGEAEDFNKAIEYFESALKAEDSLVTLKDIEQLANFEARRAARMWTGGKVDDRKKIENIILNAIKRLKTVSENLAAGRMDGPQKKGEDRGETAERLSLLGSAYKRWAQISKDNRNDKLNEMLEHYKKAYHLKKDKGKIDSYPLINWLTADLALRWHKDRKRRLSNEEFLSLIAASLSTLQSEIESAPNFWSRSMYADIQLIELLFTKSLTEDNIKEITEKYQDARKLGSPRQFDSVLDQIDFLTEMAGENKELKEVLIKLKQNLKQK